ncbi:mannitol ABC transporter, permease [Streptomyces himastatinicus ATCC 53653]|uniref:Mannitol ABC transporter, permease n=1 Tax=Streptomyces himastatinicus ATCC 53653 TaxID=457427 RepID=D9WCJ7_9ACTN|nr:mannitol ABC transporter, permease [Streptomyces himastatinicus ATCC 53653]
MRRRPAHDLPDRPHRHHRGSPDRPPGQAPRRRARPAGLVHRHPVRPAGAVDAAHLVPLRERRRHQPALPGRPVDPRRLQGVLRRGRPGASPWPALLNSMGTSLFSTLFVLVLALPAAYALSIRRVRKWTDVMFFFLSTKMLPVVAGLLPVYLFAKDTGFLDNVWLLVILYTSMNLPIAVWMMQSFLADIPVSIIEAAQMDGARLTTILWRVVAPIAGPGIAATSLICFIFSWNEMLFAQVLTGVVAQTAPAFLTGFVTSQGLFLAQVCAASIVISLPVLAAGFAAQDKLVQGLSLGAVK